VNINKLEELNKIAQNYHLNSDLADKFIEDICQEYCCDWLEKLIDYDSNVLELGYGEGITVARLSKKSKNYTILEGSSYLTQKIKKEYNDIKIINTLFEEFKPETQYDTIFALHVFEHIEEPILLMQQMRAWLEADGVMVVVVPNKESIHRRLALSMGMIPTLDTLSERDKLVGHQRVYSISELEQDFLNAGYSVIEKKGFFLKTLPNSMMLNYTPDLIYALNRCSEKIPPEICANIAIRVKLNPQ
jgi:2-polyprenyl-3-methyl-5-hydroxy-6-metoxy-1,4-benzoquinol methylase